MSKQIQQIILCQICLSVMSIICPVAYLTSGNAENPMAMMSLIFVFFFIFLLSDGLVIGLAWGIGKENLKNAMVVSNILLPRRQERRAVFGLRILLACFALGFLCLAIRQLLRADAAGAVFLLLRAVRCVPVFLLLASACGQNQHS